MPKPNDPAARQRELESKIGPNLARVAADMKFTSNTPAWAKRSATKEDEQRLHAAGLVSSAEFRRRMNWNYNAFQAAIGSTLPAPDASVPGEPDAWKLATVNRILGVFGRELIQAPHAAQPAPSPAGSLPNLMNVPRDQLTKFVPASVLPEGAATMMNAPPKRSAK